jgi:4'-phosphopantetheinyl transferase
MRSSLFAVKLDFPMNDSLFESLAAVVSEERRQRAKRFLRREDACRSVVGEALARRCIGQREHVAPHMISFIYNEHEKPAVSLPYKTHFNVSHSGQWVVCAVDDRAVGVDVERIHDIDFEISKRFFSSTEHEDVASNSEAIRKERFFDYWSLKESYIKAIGKGLFCSLGSFTVILKNGRIGMKADDGLPIMFFKQYDIDPGYKCAVCAPHEEDLPEEVVFVKAEELTSPGH